MYLLLLKRVSQNKFKIIKLIEVYTTLITDVAINMINMIYLSSNLLLIQFILAYL